jgi:hypothetical protein
MEDRAGLTGGNHDEKKGRCAGGNDVRQSALLIFSYAAQPTGFFLRLYPI